MGFSDDPDDGNTMGCEDVECLIGLLSRRYDLLEALSDGAQTKNELESMLGVSRSTVDRAVRSLEEEDFVVRGTGGVSLTLVGRIVLDGYRRFRSGLVGLDQARPLFHEFHRDELLPFELFRDADVINANRQSPHRPIVALQQFLDDATTVKSIVTGLIPEYVEFYRTQIVDRETAVELVVQSPVLDELLATYWDSMDEALSTGRLTVYETPTDPPYSLKVAETDSREVGMVTYGDQGVSGFIRSDDERAVEWAEAVYRRTKSDATLVAPME